MKAMGYQPSVGLKVGQTPAQQASGNPLAYGTGGSGYDAIGRGIGAVLNAYEKEREEEMVADVTAAKNEYDKRISNLLYNEDSGLMRRKLDGARGIGREYEEEEKKIRQDVMKNMLPQYEKAHRSFTSMVDPAAQRNFNTVRDYSLQQKDAYRDVNYANAVNFMIENAQHYYQDPSAVSEQLDQIKKTTWANYVSQNGEEWCAAKFDETETKVVQSVIETALANGDTEAAKNLMSAFGDRVPPSALNKYRKGILEADKNDYMITTAEQLARDNGYDDAKTDAAIDKMTSYEIASGGSYYKMKETYDEYKGTPYDWGGNGKDGIDCSSFTQKAYASAGEQIPRTSEAQLRYMEQKGRFVANDGKYTPQAGDLVFITGTNAKFKPTDDWAASQDPDKNLAYKGVTHVGFVSERGTILQAGSKGVSEVPMSAFEGKIMGYGKAAGTQSVSMSAADKEKLKRITRANNARHKQDEERRISATKNSIEDAMFALYEKGVTDPAQYMAIAKRYSSDSDVYRWAVMRADSFTKHSVSGGGSAGGLSKDAEAEVKDDIDLGEYRDENALREELEATGASPAEIRNLIDYYRDNEFKDFDWAAMEQRLYEKLKIKDKTVWMGAKAIAQDYIREERAKGNTPSQAQVQAKVFEAGAKPDNWLGDGIRQAYLPVLGWKKVKEHSDGSATVIYRDGRQEDLTEEEYEEAQEQVKEGEVKK